MSKNISIIDTGKKYSFKDKEDLKEKIYELSLDNIDEAKRLYGLLIPTPTDMNILISNSEQAVNCLRIIREQSESLVKLFGEINRAEKDLGDPNKQIGPGVIYDVLAELEAQEKKEENDNPKKEVIETPSDNSDSTENEKNDLERLYENIES